MIQPLSELFVGINLVIIEYKKENNDLRLGTLPLLQKMCNNISKNPRIIIK